MLGHLALDSHEDNPSRYLPLQKRQFSKIFIVGDEYPPFLISEMNELVVLHIGVMIRRPLDIVA